MLRILVIVTAIFAVSPSTQAQTTLMAKWETGEIRKYLIDDEYTSKSTAGQQTFELHQSLTLDTTWEAKGTSPDGDVKLSVSIDRVRYRADGKGAAAIIQNLGFDSNAETQPKGKPEQGVAKVLKSYVGLVGEVAIDGHGNVTDFSLSDELSKKLEDTAARELAGFFGDLFTPSGLRHRLTNWLVTFPAEPSPDGATWSQELPSRFAAKIVAIRYYELVGSTRKDADTFLQVNITPQFKVSDDTKLKITTQRGDGHVYLDKETHQTREFVLRHGGSIADFGEQTFDIVYSATLRSEGHEGE
jgi:hypothetical protein